MRIRERTLPSGWYPDGDRQIVKEIESFLEGTADHSRQAIAGVAPHAGWTFSGRIAARVIRALDPEVETLAVVGGHLHASEGVLAAREEGYKTPLGVIPADLALLGLLDSMLEIREDRAADNTVEIQLPLVRHCLPKAKALYLRAAPSAAALKLGEALAEAAKRLGKKLAVLGSTDLTHYGPSYGFSPHGTGPEAVRWVREVNDRRFIDALLEGRLEQAFDLALKEKSACSAGGAAAAAAFARCRGTAQGELLAYATSYDIHPHSSFVGYAGIIYPRSPAESLSESLSSVMK